MILPLEILNDQKKKKILNQSLPAAADVSFFRSTGAEITVGPGSTPSSLCVTSPHADRSADGCWFTTTSSCMSLFVCMGAASVSVCSSRGAGESGGGGFVDTPLNSSVESKFSLSISLLFLCCSSVASISDVLKTGSSCAIVLLV